MRLFRWIFRIIFSLILLVVVTVGVPIALLYKSVTPPEIDNTVTIDFEELLNTNLDNLIDETNDDKKINLFVGENYINYEIYKAVIEALEDNLTTESGYVAEFEGIGYLQGVWVSFGKDTINLNAGIHLKYSGITFKTRLLVSIKLIEVSPKQVKVKLEKINIGNLPLRWIVRVAPSLAKRIANMDIEAEIENALENLGTYDSSKMELTIDVPKLIEDNLDQEVASLAASLVNLLADNEIASLKIDTIDQEKGLNLNVDLNPIKDNKVAVELDEADRIKTETEFQDFIEGKVLKGMISSNISFSDNDLSKLIDYFLVDAANAELMKENIFEDYEIVVLTPYFEIGSKATLNVPIRFGKPGHYFKSNLSVDVSFMKDRNNLKLILTNTNIGTLSIPDELLEGLLSQFETEEMTFSGLSFVIEDFFANFSDEQIKVKDITVANDKLNMNFDIQVSDLLNEIIDEFGNPEIVQIVEDILDRIDDFENVDEEEIMDLLDDLLDEFNNLDEAEQERLMDLITQFFDPEDFIN